MTSITETSNELTGDLDCVDTQSIIRLFRQTDAQIFSGYKSFMGVNDTEFIDILVNVVHSIDSILQHSNEKIEIVMAGAGTSGRLAYFLTRTFNRYCNANKDRVKNLDRITFHYLIAGGDRSLTVGIEGAEDSIDCAIKDMNSIVSSNPRSTIVYFGITCGFSAPYVAAQLDYLMDLNYQLLKQSQQSLKKHVISLIGFNPLDRSRKIKIEQWNQSFDDVAQKLNKLRKFAPSQHHIINPVIGPEPLTGSTRMKSGSTTKIILEVIFSSLIMVLENRSKVENGNQEPSPTNTKNLIISMINRYEETCRATYRNIESIAKMVDSTGSSLRTENGHLYYIAADSLGIVGFIDASETVPTFGAGNLDVRGIIMDDLQNKKSGWDEMDNLQGDQSHISEQYRISEQHFTEKICPNSLSTRDTVIISINSNLLTANQVAQFQNIINLIQSKEAKLYILYFTNSSSNSSSSSSVPNQFTNIKEETTTFIEISLPWSDILPSIYSYYEMSLKWIYNACTTGGFIIKGKVYGNRMIDLGLTNNKLFYRSCGIVESLVPGTSGEFAKECIIRAIYSYDMGVPIPEKIVNASVYEHIDFSNQHSVRNVVPVALLLASKQYISPIAIRDLIKQQPIIRLLLSDSFHQSKSQK